MQAIVYNEKFFIENFSHADDDDELYLKHDWSSDTMSIRSNTSSSHSNDPEGCGERLSLAYEDLSRIPRKIAEECGRKTKILDLSHNSIKDLSFLTHFRQLHTLILDKNSKPDENTFPSLPTLELLWLNNCDIVNVQSWAYRIRDCCPSLRYLSLLGNPGATSSFNGGTTDEHTEYRMMIISILPQLRHLDDAEVTPMQKVQARQFRHNYNISKTPFNIFESIGRAEQMGKKAAQRKSWRSQERASDDS